MAKVITGEKVSRLVSRAAEVYGRAKVHSHYHRIRKAMEDKGIDVDVSISQAINNGEVYGELTASGKNWVLTTDPTTEAEMREARRKRNAVDSFAEALLEEEDNE